MRHANTITSLAVAALLSAPALAQSSLWSLSDDEAGGFGSATAGVGDVDGDGTPDVAVNLPALDTVRVLSGVDGSLLMELAGTAASGFGEGLAGVGDVDGDGVPDVAIGAPRAESLTGELHAGALVVVSGADGSTFWADPGLTAFDELGTDVVALGDIDLDGRGDLAYAAAVGHRRCKVVSGASGGTLATLEGVYLDYPFGVDVAGGGDVDGDGVPDLAAITRSSTTFVDGLDVYSGAALAAGQPGLVFRHESGPATVPRIDLCDHDGDGVSEVLLGDPSHYPNGVQGRVLVLDAQGQAVGEYTGLPGQDVFGIGLRTLGDADGDGRDDLVVRSYDLEGFGGGAQASMVSGAQGRLIANSRGDIPIVLTRVGDLDGDGLADLLATWRPAASFGPGTVIATSSRQGTISEVGASCQPAGSPPLGLWVYGEASAGGSLSVVATGPQAGDTVWLGLGAPAAPTVLPSGCAVHIAPLLALVPVALDAEVPGVGHGAGLVIDVPPSISAFSVGVQAFGKDHQGALVLSAAQVVDLVD